MGTLRVHEKELREGRLVLRPMTEGDRELLVRWNSDREVHDLCDSHEYSGPEELMDMYREVSQTAFNFIIGHEGRPIGECWLQHMNIPALLEEFPGKDLRRIDLMIGEKGAWNLGLGTRVIAMLCSLGFESENCDAIFACFVSSDNPRSMRVFRKNGFSFHGTSRTRTGEPVPGDSTLILERQDWLAGRGG